MDNIVWKNISHLPGYQISSDGHVKKSKQLVQLLDDEGNVVGTNEIEARLLPVVITDGYRSVSIQGKTYAIHRLVASAFLECPDDSKYHVHFKDGNKLNPSLGNLEWITVSDETKLQIQSGIRSNPKPYGGVKVKCVTDGTEYNSIGELATKLQMHRTTLARYLNQQKAIRGKVYKKVAKGR